MKPCSKCSSELPLSAFYPRSNKCKECTKKGVRSNRLANVEYYREYDRERGKLPHRLALSTVTTARWRREHPKGLRAHNAVARAVRKGKLFPMPCIICGNDAVEAHHPDYDQPLDVIWLCSVHHKEVHLCLPKDLDIF